MATYLRIASASRADFISLAWSRHAKSARFSAALVNIATARLDFARSCTIHATCSSHAMKNLQRDDSPVVRLRGGFKRRGFVGGDRRRRRARGFLHRAGQT